MSPITHDGDDLQPNPILSFEEQERQNELAIQNMVPQLTEANIKALEEQGVIPVIPSPYEGPPHELTNLIKRRGDAIWAERVRIKEEGFTLTNEQGKIIREQGKPVVIPGKPSHILTTDMLDGKIQPVNACSKCGSTKSGLTVISGQKVCAFGCKKTQRGAR